MNFVIDLEQFGFWNNLDFILLMYYLLSSPIELAFLTWFLGFFVILTFKKPHWAIFLTIFLHPLYLLKFRLGFIPLNVLEAMVLILFLIKRPKIYFTDKYLSLGVLFLILGVGFGVLVSPDILKSAGIFKSWFLIPLLFFLIIKQINIDKKRYALNPLLFNGLILAAGTIVFWFKGVTLWDGRVSFIYNSPNYLAMVLGPALLISLLAFKGYLRFFGSALITWALILTQSASGILSVLISLIIYFLLMGLSPNTISLRKPARLRRSGGCIWRQPPKQKKKLFRVIIIGYIITSIVFVLLLPKLNLSMFNLERFGLLSLDSRFIIWRSAVMVLKDNFIMGIGPGMFQENYLDYQRFFPSYREWAVSHSHNILLSFWLEAGFLGLLGFLIIIFAVFKKEKRLWLGTIDNINLEKRIAFIIIFFFLIFGIADTAYWKNDLSLLFWLAIGLIEAEH